MNAPADERFIRAEYLGSSDIAAILGLSRYKTAYDVWIGKIAPETVEAPSEDQRKLFRRGKLMEPVIRETATDEFGLHVLATNQRYSHPSVSFLRAEVDFEVWEDGQIVNCEAKSVHPRQWQHWGEADSDEVPVDYWTQVQFALAITGRTKAYVFALFGADDLVRYIIEADHELHGSMVLAAEKFWNEHVLTSEPPPPQTYDDAVRILYRMKRGGLFAADEALLDLLQRHRDAAQQVKLAENVLDEAKADIAAWAVKAAQERGTDVDQTITFVDANGRPVATWNSQRGAYLDQRRLKAAHPDLVTQFTVSNEYRVLRHK